MTPSFDIGDFHRRWEKARMAAIRAVAGPSGHSPGEAEDLERFLTQTRLRPDRDQAVESLLRGVFDNSRKLGLSLSRNCGVTFEIGDFQDLLRASGTPCAQGEWTARPGARALGRKGCGFCPGAGAYACDYWREACDGLVMGLGDRERLVRHACVRRGDAVCIDVFYTEADGNEGETPAWGPVPEHMAIDLFESAAYMRRRHGAAVGLKGFREGILYFEFTTATDAVCGQAGLLTTAFRDLVQEKHPGLSVRDVTPRSVLAAEAGL